MRSPASRFRAQPLELSITISTHPYGATVDKSMSVGPLADTGLCLDVRSPSGPGHRRGMQPPSVLRKLVDGLGAAGFHACPLHAATPRSDRGGHRHLASASDLDVRRHAGRRTGC